MSKNTEKRKIVRTYSAGVFFGEIISRKKDEVVIKNARRLWYWSGASSLSQLAVDGVKRPADCKFPATVSSITVLGVIEILDVTPEAGKVIDSVPVWAQ